MSQVVVRNLEDEVKAGLKKRASLHGWSMEEEARQILRKAVLADSSSARLGSRIAARFAGCGLVEDLPELHGQVIVGIALIHKARIATRNTRHFDDLPGTVINPWDARIPPGEK